MNAILGDDYTYEEQGGIIKVYKKTNKSRMRHKMFTLYYTNVTEAKKVITPLLSDSGKIEATAAAETGVPADESISSNSGDGGDNLAMNDTIIVYDFPENLERIEQVLTDIDKRPRQVLVEAAILSVSLNEDMQFGVDWQTLKGSPVSKLEDMSEGDPDYFGSKGGASQVTTSGGIAMGLVNGNISTFIQAVESVTDVTLLANPKILAVNKQLGQVYIGTKLGYVSQTTQTETSTTQEVEFLDTGTKLSFRPYIGNDGYIRMDIHPKDSSGSFSKVGDSNSTSTIPDETSAELVTNILVKDEQTVVIGGLFRDKITKNKTQVPILGDIPIIGNLFKGTSDSIVRKEVMVLLTPHIIEKPSEVQGNKRKGDYERAKYGAYKGLHQLGRTRIAQDCYERAVKYYENNEYEKSLAEIDTALKIHPTYMEALRLQEKLLKETSDVEFKESGRVLMEELEEKQAPMWDK
jgi:type II secretory pathway component GspD/PulD (secretin)